MEKEFKCIRCNKVLNFDKCCPKAYDDLQKIVGENWLRGAMSEKLAHYCDDGGIGLIEFIGAH